MDEALFEKLKWALETQLTPDQCVELEAVVGRIAARRLGEAAIARHAQEVAEARHCPRCGHTDVVKHGKDKAGRQRFRCRRSPDGGCGRSFNAMTGTPFAHMRMPEKWGAYAHLMERHVSLDKVVETGIGISRYTAFRWRHRFLAAQAALQPEQVAGVIEADETFFRTAYKGHRGWKKGRPPENRPPRYRGGPAKDVGLSAEQVPVLTALDSGGGVIEEVLRSRAAIGTALNGRVAEGSVVCSDGLKAYVEVAKRHGSEHRCIAPPRKDWLAKAKGGKPRKKGRLGLGHVNAHHERLKTFINRQLRGVSTRYLHHYLGWARAMRRADCKPEQLISQALAHLLSPPLC
jgi:transposase-like protein